MYRTIHKKHTHNTNWLPFGNFSCLFCWCFFYAGILFLYFLSVSLSLSLVLTRFVNFSRSWSETKNPIGISSCCNIKQEFKLVFLYAERTYTYTDTYSCTLTEKVSNSENSHFSHFLVRLENSVLFHLEVLRAQYNQIKWKLKFKVIKLPMTEMLLYTMCRCLSISLCLSLCVRVHRRIDNIHKYTIYTCIYFRCM